jgi:hypothetical protein
MSTHPVYTWKEISPEAYSCLYVALGGGDAMKVFGAITDMDGIHGDPLIMTEWGPKDADYPMLRSEHKPKKPGEGKTFIAVWREVHA